MKKENGFLTKPEGSAADFLVLIYKDDDSDNILNAYLEGTDWHGNKKISDISDIKPDTKKSPCAVTYNNKLYIFYKGSDSSDIYSACYNGMVWEGNTPIYEQAGSIKVQSDESPCAVVANGKICLFYKNHGSNSIYAASFDGTKWRGNTNINDQPGNARPTTDLAPNAVVFHDNLYLFYKKTASIDLYYTVNNGTVWSACQALSVGASHLQSPDTPHAAVYKDLLKLIYRDPSSTSFYISSFDGSVWSGNTKITDYTEEQNVQPQSTYGPSAIEYDEKVYIFYESDKNVCEAWFDGSHWYGAKPIYELSDKAIKPKSSRTPGCVIY